ncbi:MAG: hypothetical protein JW869_03180 [Candidatus Omnitrophica bacterium]|nr:hypothetical protein [Candidatus Omnitrophota bacterium]
MDNILDSSITVSFVKLLYRGYSRLEQQLRETYFDSKTCRLIGAACRSIKICFKYSILGRISETEAANPASISSDSYFGRLVSDTSAVWEDRSLDYSKTSFLADLAMDAKRVFDVLFVGLISILIIIMVALNLFLSLALGKEISFWGYLMRGFFLSIACLGLLCRIDWPTLKKSSIFLKICRRK